MHSPKSRGQVDGKEGMVRTKGVGGEERSLSLLLSWHGWGHCPALQKPAASALKTFVYAWITFLLDTSAESAAADGGDLQHCARPWRAL
jgi:hypothetical protein